VLTCSSVVVPVVTWIYGARIVKLCGPVCGSSGKAFEGSEPSLVGLNPPSDRWSYANAITRNGLEGRDQYLANHASARAMAVELLFGT
jgi:hypothetical protein